MALLPSRQFYPTTTSFLDSFHSTRLQFFRYGSSNRFRTHSSYVTRNTIASNSTNPQRKSNIVFTNTPVSQYDSGGVSSSGGNWIDKWNGPHQKSHPKESRPVMNYRNSETVSRSDGGSGGGSTMEKIVEKLKKFGYMDDVKETKENVQERIIEKGSIEDIFYIEEGILPNPQGGFSLDSPLGVENKGDGNGEVRFPWERPKVEEGSVRIKSRTSLAELTLPESELRRLRNLTMRTKNKTKIGGGGVTQAVVDMIREKWKTSEIVKLKCEGAAALNMRRIHEILERKTGGLVIWRSGTSVSLYRGVSYEVPVQLNKRVYKKNETSHSSFSSITPNSFAISSNKTSGNAPAVGSNQNVHASQATLNITDGENKDTESEVKYEDEIDKLLDGLGPRYTDWPGCDPLPIDADLLPGKIHGYQPPFRILPYGVRSSLGLKEATALRRLARVLPPHFALGRSRQLEGLAMAMIKLWERSSIAKVALKRGVQLTTSERMAEDIKKLTGGVLLSRNKDFLVFYRGKNFLSSDVTEALLERERLAKALQDEEEQARLRASTLITPTVGITEQVGSAGTLGETLEADARWGKRLDDHDKQKMLKKAEVARHANLVRKLERRLALAERKLMKAENALSKVEEFLKPANRPADPESITDEERFMFRKLGLRMKAFLLLGRRGVFSGTVENMHLHWKYRELVKIIVKAKTFDQVKKTALALESESGGVLVSVDKVSKGFAIVVFRGKDYQRPSTLRPKNLLTKRKALARSIELQRREALYNHISALQRNVEKLRSEIEQMDIVKDHGDEELYDKLDSAYATEDEHTEEEGDEAYLETYADENDGEHESDNSIHNHHIETNFPYDIQGEEFETEAAVQDEESETEPEAPKPHMHMSWSGDGGLRTDRLETEDASLQ